ncbi:hypothetical protein AMS68_008058 [Peltaster fructicola]|uniref:Uncharacterized protein n=1 Tax=Peltaster fructicola TaxID=286661 RepID=A0A6H0Y6S4_9PEZI|nr:hypothetical protein AMS68_008058 [Peltaster fructicola]
MFPAEFLNASYLEEQAAARQQREAAKMQNTLSVPATSTSTPATTRPTTPANATIQSKPLGLLTNIFQGLVKATTFDPQELQCKSTSSSPGCEKSELEALIAERKRDADICSLRPW